MRLIVCICLLFTLALPVAATADNKHTTLDEAVKHIKQKSDLRVLAAERVKVNGKLMYRIKVLTEDGRVKYVWVDPEG
ncbi:MAG: hypothetical protein WB783_08195 [Arenicellales bacterium]